MEDPGGLTYERIDIAVMRDRLHGQHEVERAFRVLQPIDVRVGDMDPSLNSAGSRGRYARTVRRWARRCRRRRPPPRPASAAATARSRSHIRRRAPSRLGGRQTELEHADEVRAIASNLVAVREPAAVPVEPGVVGVGVGLERATEQPIQRFGCAHRT